MLQFSEDYFKKEERDGFLVGEVMKRVWAAQLETLQKVIEICEKHGLTYYVYWGTLLGTVRHKGYIPWDDDIDIALKGDDYVKFLSIANQELPEGYKLWNVYTENDWDEYFTHITNGPGIDFGEKRMKEFHNCPMAVGLDVFPLYYVPRDKQAAEDLKVLLTYISALIVAEQDKKREIESGAGEELIQEYDSQIALGLEDLEKLTGFRFGGSKTLVTQLNMLYDQVCRIYREEESDCVTAFPTYLLNGLVFEKELLQETIDMPFENLMVKAPAEYDTILKKVYGDYMIPKRNAGAHDYIWFKKQTGLISENLSVSDFLNKAGKQELHTNVRVMSSKELDHFAQDAKEILPMNWWNKIYQVNEAGETSRKKIVLYGTSLNDILCHSEMVIEKLNYVFTTFQKQKDVVLWWVPYSLEGKATEPIKGMIPDLLEEYKEIVRKFQEEDWGIYDDSGDIGRALTMGDAYYGDEGVLFPYFCQTGKPVMCQDYDIV